jgi:hypothetical protein
VFIHVGWVKQSQQRQENIRTIQRQVSSLQHNILSQHPLATHNQHPLYHVQTRYKNPRIQYMVFRFVSFSFFLSQTTVVLENKLAERAFRKAGAL